MSTDARPLTIATPAGALAAVLHVPAASPAPSVICCHGLMSSKDSEKLATLCRMLADAGFNAWRFDFGGCGESTAAFEISLLHSRSRDLRNIFRYVEKLPEHRGTFGLFGSSLGGYLSFQMAAENPAVNAVATLAAPFDLARIHLEPGEGERYLNSLETGLALGEPASLAHLPEGRVKNALVMHGKNDETVPWRQAEEVFGKAGNPRNLMVFDGADHRFLDPVQREQALRAAVQWFQSCLAKQQSL